jgi:hypothetical protein
MALSTAGEPNFSANAGVFDVFGCSGLPLQQPERCPEVGFWAGTTPSGVLESEVVVHGLAQFLLAAKIALSCLNGCMPQQELNLLKFSAR